MFFKCFGFRPFLSFLHRVGLRLESFIAHSYTCHSRAGGNPWIHKSPNLKKLWAPACAGVTGKGRGDSVSYQAAERLIKTITSMAISLCLLTFSTLSPAHGSSSCHETLQEASPSKNLIPQCSPLVHALVEEFCASPEHSNSFYAGPERKYSDTFRYSVKNFLGLLPYDKDEVLLSRKDKIFNYLATCSHTLSQVYFFDDVPVEERLEVFDALEVLEFPKHSDHAEQITWLSFMPKGKRKELWPIFCAEVQAFAAKYPGRDLRSILSSVAPKLFRNGQRFAPGVFPWETLYDTSEEEDDSQE